MSDYDPTCIIYRQIEDGTPIANIEYPVSYNEFKRHFPGIPDLKINSLILTHSNIFQDNKYSCVFVVEIEKVFDFLHLFSEKKLEDIRCEYLIKGYYQISTTFLFRGAVSSNLIENNCNIHKIFKKLIENMDVINSRPFWLSVHYKPLPEKGTANRQLLAARVDGVAHEVDILNISVGEYVSYLEWEKCNPGKTQTEVLNKIKAYFKYIAEKRKVKYEL